jgi:hypothetical protein
MFTNDPFQTQLTSLTSGAYAGAMNPFGLPYTQLQSAINPALLNPLAGAVQTGGISPFGQQGYAGIPNYGAIAQQLQQQQQLQQIQQQVQQLQQLASILASQGAIPQQFGLTNPWQNPLSGQNPLVNPILAQQLALQSGSIYGQPQFGQAGSPFAQAGYPLAPQSWVGQQVPGQIHPHQLSQLAARGLY